MKEQYLIPLYTPVIILMLFTAGCVAPPQENSTFKPLDTTQNLQQTTTQPSYVSEVTISDYKPTTLETAGYTTFQPTTQIPADISCRIDSLQLSGYNGTAFIFDLKNPPMYINYSVVPRNVTVNKVYTDSYTKQTTTRTFTDFSTTSWFEVTVRDNATKEIILQDGFGPYKGYSAYMSRTLKILKSGDLLVEFRGNDIQASAMIWVKPIGNFEDSRLSEFTDCTYWDSHRDSIPIATETTVKGGIYTWTPENQYTTPSS